MKIIVETRFINPIVGGQIEVTHRQFNIENGKAAQKYYRNQMRDVEKNRDCMHVSIFIALDDVNNT